MGLSFVCRLLRSALFLDSPAFQCGIRQSSRLTRLMFSVYSATTFGPSLASRKCC